MEKLKRTKYIIQLKGLGYHCSFYFQQDERESKTIDIITTDISLKKNVKKNMPRFNFTI